MEESHHFWQMCHATKWELLAYWCSSGGETIRDFERWTHTPPLRGCVDTDNYKYKNKLADEQQILLKNKDIAFLSISEINLGVIT